MNNPEIIQDDQPSSQGDSGNLAEFIGHAMTDPKSHQPPRKDISSTAAADGQIIRTDSSSATGTTGQAIRTATQEQEKAAP